MSLPAAVVTSEAVRELPIPAELIGVMALLAFAFLLGVTWSFRGTSQKYVRPDLTGHTPESPVGPGEESATEVDYPHWPEHPGHRH